MKHKSIAEIRKIRFLNEILLLKANDLECNLRKDEIKHLLNFLCTLGFIEIIVSIIVFYLNL